MLDECERTLMLSLCFVNRYAIRVQYSTSKLDRHTDCHTHAHIWRLVGEVQPPPNVVMNQLVMHPEMVGRLLPVPFVSKINLIKFQERPSGDSKMQESLSVARARSWTLLGECTALPDTP